MPVTRVNMLRMNMLTSITWLQKVGIIYFNGENMLGEKLKSLRKRERISQEDFAKVIGVTRQTIAKWEKDESVPDRLLAKKLAKEFRVSLDDMVDFKECELQQPILEGIDEKYIFGKIKVGVDGEIKIPKEVREVFDIKTGDQMLVIGDIERGIELISADALWEDRLRNMSGKKCRENNESENS